MTQTDMHAKTTGINWNDLVDPYDKIVLLEVEKNDWKPEEIPLGRDKKCWKEQLTTNEREVTKKLFKSLNLLDTTQTEIGVDALMSYTQTQHEKHVLRQFGYMESVHSRSYSSIFETLISSQEERELKEWEKSYPRLQYKTALLEEAYGTKERYKVHIASVFLESFIFYSGFYWPLYLLNRNLMTSTGSLIKLIIRDEAIHGKYIGYKFQKAYKNESEEKQREMLEYAHLLMLDLYKNEIKFTEELYETVNLVEEVKIFLRFNANKAFFNLGFEPLFSPEECDVNVAILRSMRSDSKTTHDFFSSKGTSYFKSSVEDTSDDDWS